MLIRQQFVTGPATKGKTAGGLNPGQYITIHETANQSKGADAQAHANLQSKGNVRVASWHWQVDDKEAIQSWPHRAQCWHGGDGAGSGNMRSIGIEICVNSDGNYREAIHNAAALVRRIMAAESIPAQRVVQHNHWSGKNCPTLLRNGSRGINWNDFMELLTSHEKPLAPPLPQTEQEVSMIPNIQALYAGYLGRQPGPLEALDWADVAAEKKLDARGLRKLFLDSPAEDETVRIAFRRFLGIDAHPDQVRTWATGGNTIKQVWDGIANSPAAGGIR